MIRLISVDLIYLFGIRAETVEGAVEEEIRTVWRVVAPVRGGG